MNMPRIAFVIYRKWAFDIWSKFAEINTGASVPLICTTHHPEFDTATIPKETKVEVIEGLSGETVNNLFQALKIDVACYFGWSLMVERETYENNLCLCLHPSALPEFRGGSPIQNQIIKGVLDSKVSLFKIGAGLDDGDIYRQYPLSLRGELSDIFERMTAVGVQAMSDFTNDYRRGQVTLTPQSDLDIHPPHKRRRPAESELRPQQLSSMSGTTLNDFIRALADPYPNAFIQIGSDRILLHKIGTLTKTIGDGLVINNLTSLPPDPKKILIQVKDGYLPITDYTINRWTAV